MRIIASDFHFGRQGYDTQLGENVKVEAANNIADFLSRNSYEMNEKPLVTIVGDLFHRPHWNRDTVERNGEGFDTHKAMAQIGSLSEVLRQGYKLTLLDGNCDPWSTLPSESAHHIIHTLLLDEREQIEIVSSGLRTVENGILYTHGHAAENMHLLLRNAMHLPAKDVSAKVSTELREAFGNESQFHTRYAKKDTQGSSHFHHIVCQTLMRMEQLESGITEMFLPTSYVRRIGNETLAHVIADATAHYGSAIHAAVFGHTHQLGLMNQGALNVWNPGSATGDLHVRPYGTFLVEEADEFTPYYSWHPDSPKEVIQVPDSHLAAFSKGRRGRRRL